MAKDTERVLFVGSRIRDMMHTSKLLLKFPMIASMTALRRATWMADLPSKISPGQGLIRRKWMLSSAKVPCPCPAWTHPTNRTELYIHTKLLIADDRIVICGSANLNDRSQLGYHDSEIAVVIEDPSLIDSVMDGKPYQASRYAASLRRQLFRKHLGLLPHQDYTKPDANFMPINKDPNLYDWGSAADFLVRDPLSREFGNLWNGTATANTAIFAKAFHCVPADHVRNWKQYEEYFQRYFVSPSRKDDKKQIPPPYRYGHVVREEFPGGARELKEWLDKVRGTLVEMPLRFMDGVYFARSGLKLNALTDEVYT